MVVVIELDCYTYILNYCKPPHKKQNLALINVHVFFLSSLSRVNVGHWSAASVCGHM